MAIALIANNPTTWVESTTTTISQACSSSFTTDNRLFVFGGWKDFAITATGENLSTGSTAFTEITEFADGSVGQGNGTGSMKVAAWYRDYVSGDESDLMGYRMSSAPSIASATSVAFSKGATETWDTPTFVTAAWPSSSAQTVNASSTITVPDGAVVMCIISIRDDSATFTRTTTSISDSGGLVTWNGNYVQQPTNHRSTTTGNDMAIDSGYRLVTTGAAGVTLQAEATLSAAETGSILWVVQSVTAAAGKSPPFRNRYYPQFYNLTR